MKQSMSWFDILKQGNHNGILLLYDPRNSEPEALMEKHHPIHVSKSSGWVGSRVKKWIPINVSGFGGSDNSPPVADHIAAIEKKLEKQLPKEMKENMLRSKSVLEFMEKVEKEGIGFIYIGPSSSWRENLHKNWWEIGMVQGNGFNNMVTAVPIPKDYWVYDTTLSNKAGVAIWGDGPHPIDYTYSKMVDEMLKLNLEEMFEDQEWQNKGHRANRIRRNLDGVGASNLGGVGEISKMIKHIIDNNLDKNWQGNKYWKMYEENPEFREYIDSTKQGTRFF